MFNLGPTSHDANDHDNLQSVVPSISLMERLDIDMATRKHSFPHFKRPQPLLQHALSLHLRDLRRRVKETRVLLCRLSSSGWTEREIECRESKKTMYSVLRLSYTADVRLFVFFLSIPHDIDINATVSRLFKRSPSTSVIQFSYNNPPTLTTMSTTTGSSLSPYASPTPVSSPFHALLLRPTLYFGQVPAFIPTPLLSTYATRRPARTEMAVELLVLLAKLEWKGVEVRKSRTAHEAHPRSRTSPTRLMKKLHDNVCSVQNGFRSHLRVLSLLVAVKLWTEEQSQEEGRLSLGDSQIPVE
ncbi:hypothetical protein BDQ17DRAFT_1436674 [Cyathus striatus]|nr:hypothetical protein BDQ17DRAFT_1436674 [Cyathus striatus]